MLEPVGQRQFPSLNHPIPNFTQPRALVLDRDGTLIEHVHYLDDPAEVRLLPGVADGLHAALDAGILLFLHSNQSGVGRGLHSLEAAHACNARMIELLGRPTIFQRICLATETPDEPPVYRKPSPRFAREIMRDFNLAADQLCYLGDRWSDLATAAAAGTRAVGVATGLTNLRAELVDHGLHDRFPICNSFAAAIQLVLGPPPRQPAASTSPGRP
jgi:D-glycero-D-manno-heptose 1,7-bisphosphate phosphatase